MRFGISTFVTDESIRPDVLGRALEDRGFDAVFLAEHSHIPVGTRYPDGRELERVYYRTLDPFVALTAAAATTERLLLGTGIALLPQRDVIHTAKEVASLDLLSGGRVILAVGAGWNREEMRNHGVDPGTRGRRMDEQLAALKLIWTQEEAEFHGEHVDFSPLTMWPKPVQKPHPPLYVGGNSKAALARVAAHGDGWFPTELAPDEIGRVREWLAERGRTGVVINVVADPDDPSSVDAYVAAGADRVTFHLTTLPESDGLRRLDALADVIARYQD
ncbi:putative F420-dependent oxidoreductase, Rv2161c family [Streptoalloteichus tenebrarius]|uniref:F420-dependent oxidoreductase, Rv2161c family n=1 Tax=Streptoalloteichus tenebrarius (strain ATCC 17920 / DSM 40477 / JCM 4838 / CBS 697.72 / NBRC 16177 / NCIMB 11028 / NRRL B-12390 / A12253. 1 / ISP 5477) TaxID=1933 RepID=A0ABT1HUW8_STRSD|nr:LLM class F420-dependent oxidoreductase [Streptoalloteichus tenebrarius]MCP2259323.1 putative F420-dependent oxidoreductase, Rv2161c family [Streptoalloteichus tenebrarius]BFE99086.1 LLM class F420-dependent oxidoreductase [Streptoalloteichus tenebrarius]